MNPKIQSTALRKFLLFLIILASPHSLLSSNKFSGKEDTLSAVVSGWKRNAHIISLGFGVPSNANSSFNSSVKPANSYTISSITKSINLHLKFEIFLSRYIGLGTTINYGKVNYDCLRETTAYYKKVIEKIPVSAEVVSLNVRINYHLLYNRVVDIYIGGGTGIRLVKTSGNSGFIPDIYRSGAFREYEFSIGARYFSKGIVGMFAELGVGRTIFQAGINFNIKS